MKKKDLVVGTIYANKRGFAFLLVSTQMWGYDRYTSEWRISRITTPAAPQGYIFSGRGALCLSGSAEGLRQWARNNTRLLDRANSELSTQADVEEFVAHLRNALPGGSNFHIVHQDYRQWPGTYEEVRAQLDKEDRAREEEASRLGEIARQRRERADIISDELDKRGVRARIQESALPGVYNQNIYAPSILQLTLTELEKVLGIENSEEK